MVSRDVTRTHTPYHTPMYPYVNIAMPPAKGGGAGPRDARASALLAPIRPTQPAVSRTGARAIG